MAYHDYDIIREQARGQWCRILLTLAPELEAAVQRAPRHVSCPVHGGIDGFRLFRDWEETGGGICNTCGSFPSGFRLLQWLTGWDFPKTLAAVAEVLGNKGVSASRNGNGHDQQRDDDWVRQLLRQTWTQAVPLDHELAKPVRLYLQHRGISGPVVPDCRCHPRLPYFEDRVEMGKYPALLFILRDQWGKAVTIHRLYLTPQGKKAPVPSPKKTMPYPSDRKLLGALVRLGQPEHDALALAEGIETALAVREATGQVCWAATSATLLEAAEVPFRIRRVVIWGDNDQSQAGQKAALRLAQRLVKEDRKVKVHIPQRPPEKKSWDWNDVLVHQGPGGFPKRFWVQLKQLGRNG